MKLTWRIEMGTRKIEMTNLGPVEGAVGGDVLAAMSPEELLAYALRLLASRRRMPCHDRLSASTKITRGKPRKT